MATLGVADSVFNNDIVSKKFPNLGSIIGAVLPYIYVISGLALLMMLIYGGITLMTAGGDPGKSKAGYGIITNALIGFVIVFIAWFVVQIAEVILGVKIFQ